MSSFDAREKILKRDAKNWAEKNGFTKYKTNAKLRQIAISRVINKRFVLKVLRQQILQSDYDSLVLRTRCLNVETLNRSHRINGLYFGDIHDTLKRKVMRSKNKEIV